MMQLNKTKNQTCPTCFRTSKSKLRIRNLDGDNIIITEICGFCRAKISQRKTTNEIWNTLRDINSLGKKIDKGADYLKNTLENRIRTYNRLQSEYIANLPRESNEDN